MALVLNEQRKFSTDSLVSVISEPESFVQGLHLSRKRDKRAVKGLQKEKTLLLLL